MGKSRTKNSKNKRKFNPIGLQSVKDEEQVEAEFAVEPSTARPTVQESLQNILDEIQSGDEETKVMSLVGLSYLDDVELDKNAVKIITPMLAYPSSTVQISAADSIRCLVMRGASVADMMVEVDIMTPLIAQLKKYSEDLYGKVKDPEKVEVFTSLVKLLWTLCENSEAVMPHVNTPDMLELLLAAWQSGDSDIAIPAAQCLLTITEDNPTAFEYLSKQQERLLTVLGDNSNEPDFLHLQCLTAGVVANLYNLLPREEPTILTMLLNVISRSLSTNIMALIATTPEYQNDDKMEEEATNEFAGRKESPNRVAMKVTHILDSQITALELLANICFTYYDDDEMDTSSCEDDLSEAEGCEDESTSSHLAKSVCMPAVPVEVHEAIQNHDLVRKTMDMIQSVPKDILSRYESYDDGLCFPMKLHTRQSHALLTLPNLVKVLTLEEVGGLDGLIVLWKTLVNRILNDWQDDFDLIESATSSLCGIASRLAEDQVGQALVDSVEVADLEMFAKLARESSGETTKTNVYRMFASIAVIMNKNFSPAYEPLLLSVGAFLLDQGCNEKELWVAAEALDALMDALAEDCTDKVCKELNLVPRLKALLPSLQSKIRASQNSLGSKLAIVTTVKTNLARFIKYKAARP